ncbi:methionine/alanine import family NSS transporter small subunit [Actinomyces sp. F1_1611]
MSGAALIMMAVTLLIIWGGLVASVIALKVLPVPTDQPGENAEAAGETAGENAGESAGQAAGEPAGD